MYYLAESVIVGQDNAYAWREDLKPNLPEIT